MTYKMKGWSGWSPLKHGKNPKGTAPHTDFKTETEHEEYHDIYPTEDLNKAEMKEASKPKNTIKSIESVHGQLDDAEEEYQNDLKTVKKIKQPK